MGGRILQYTYLGRTGLLVSRLCLGTVNFGTRTTEPDSLLLMDRALEHGLNFFDTANSYGGQPGKGVTEGIIGRWFGQGCGRRDKTVLATKAYSPTSDWPNDGGLSARHLITACEDSLRRLGTDWIDVYQMHHVDRRTPWEEIWQAMELLISSGKVRYVGSSNFAGWHLVAATEAARRRNLLGVVSEQCRYNLLYRYVELEVLPAAQEYGIGILAWSPLARGLLAGALRKIDEGTAVRARSGGVADELHRFRATIEGYESLADQIGIDPVRLGLAWLLARPEVTAPIIGPRTVAQLDGALGALETVLTADQSARLNELFPPVGSGGPAPEAWAW